MAPKICMTHEWVLCLDQDNEQNELADHIAMLYKYRKQDSVFFIGENKELLRNLALLEPSMFRSSCPVFMPLGLSDAIDLRLDTNILFYKNINVEYHLVDKFSVNGGAGIELNVAFWDERDGLKVEMRVNRWERRTDLMGATFLNTLWHTTNWAEFIYNDSGSIIGSKGWFQEKLFYITDRLNLTVKIREEIIVIEDKPTQVLCDRLLIMNLTDVCSGGMPIKFPRIGVMFAMPIATDHRAMTLIAGVPTGTAPDAWVYLDVYDLSQWVILISILIVISLGLSILARSKKYPRDSRRPSVFEGFELTCMYFIQQGSHPGYGHLTAKRVLTLTTSMLTFLVFVYYSNDITAKMTAGSPPIPVRTFEDVLDRDYKVILVGTYSYDLLAKAKVGSAKHSVFKLYFEKYDEKVRAYENALEMKTKEQLSDEIKWYDWTQHNIDRAYETIIADQKTLFYCHSSCHSDAVEKGQVIALKMDDTHYTLGGYWLREDSEYLSVFNYYLLKAFETGILQRLDMVWNHDTKPEIKIGLTEPEALSINNVMFPFSLLGVSIIISTIIVGLEKMVKLLGTKYSKGREIFK